MWGAIIKQAAGAMAKNKGKGGGGGGHLRTNSPGQAAGAFNTGGGTSNIAINNTKGQELSAGREGWATYDEKDWVKK